MGSTEVNIVIAFVFGALSFVSPCVLPLLPGYLSLMSGYSTVDLAEGRAPARKVVASTALFVAGFTLVFILLGASASALGSFLFRNQVLLTRLAGGLIIAMGLFIAATALWSSRWMLPLLRERRFDVRPSRLGPFAAPVMGMAFAFGWTPCIGPVLAGIFTLAGTEETVGRGMLLLAAYSIGLGIPFLLSALLMAKAFSVFSMIKRHARGITVASGLLLAVFGLMMMTGTINELASRFSRLLIDLGLEDLAVS